MSDAGVIFRVCVIGAGSSGIAAVKALRAARDRRSTASRSPIASAATGSSATPTACRRPTVAAHQHVARPDGVLRLPDAEAAIRTSRITRRSRAYFDAYVDHFGLRERITFRDRRERAEPQRRRAGQVDARRRARRARYDALLVANGHHWDPRWPEPAFPGADASTAADALARLQGRRPELFGGKRVVVLGMGNSRDGHRGRGLAGRRAQTFLAARRGAQVIPKYVFGKPARPVRHAPRGMPWQVRQRVHGDDAARSRRGHGALRAAQARPPARRGAPDDLGRHPRPPRPRRRSRRSRTSQRLTATRCVFADGSEERADVVVYCTGYKVTFPFFDESSSRAPDNDLPLFRRVFHPDLAGPRASSACCSRSARSCRSPRRSREWSPTTSPARYALPPRGRDARRHRARAPSDAPSATSRPSGTRCRSTSTTTCRPRKERSRARAGRGARSPLPVRRARPRQPRRPRRDGDARRRRRPTGRRSSPPAARSSPRHGYDARQRPRHRPPHGPRVGHVLQLLPGKARSSALLEEVGAEARAAVRAAPAAAATPRVRRRGLPRVLRLHRRGPGDVRLRRAQRGGAPAGRRSSELREDLAGPPEARASIATTRRTRWSPWDCKVGRAMLARGPVEVDRATAFAAGLFAGVICSTPPSAMRSRFDYSSSPARSRWRCLPPPRPPSRWDSARTSRPCSATRSSRGWAASGRE